MTISQVSEVNRPAICPAAPLRESVPVSGNGQGTADKAWVRWTSDNKTKFFGSYGFNSWLYTRDPGWNPLKRQFLFNGEANIQQPSATPVFADENWVDGDASEGEPPCYDVYAGNPLTIWAITLAGLQSPATGASGPRALRAKCLREANCPQRLTIGMADGHAELVPLERLWTLSWHLDWQVPAVRPP